MDYRGTRLRVYATKIEANRVVLSEIQINSMVMEYLGKQQPTDTTHVRLIFCLISSGLKETESSYTLIIKE